MLDRTKRLLSAGIRKLSMYFSEEVGTQTPVIQAITTPYNLSDVFTVGNIYDVCESIVDWDADVRGILGRMSHLCRMTYHGIYIEAGKKLEPIEEDLLEFARNTAEELDFAAEQSSICYDLLKFGDVVKHMVWDVNNGVTELQNLPRTQLTAVESKGNIGGTKSVSRANWYILNETRQKEEIFDAKTCVQFPLNNKSSRVYDLRSRVTYNVWSKAPMLSLLATMKWKLNSVINDILWTHRNVPREHHKLDLSMYTPDTYSGTPEQRIKAAENAALAAAVAYQANMQKMKADVGYVTDKNTEIGYVEPKSTNYQAPNEKVAQINESLSNCLGLTPVVRQQSFAAALMSGSFAVLQAVSLAEIARRGLEAVLRRSLEVQYGPRFKERDRRKIKIRQRLILEKDRSEVMRQIAIMIDANTVMPTFTPTEIRREWGYEPLTPDEVDEIIDYMSLAKGEPTGRVRTIRQIIEKEKEIVRNRPANWPEYESERGYRDELR